MNVQFKIYFPGEGFGLQFLLCL